jgi:hypothetical protein
MRTLSNFATWNRAGNEGKITRIKINKAKATFTGRRPRTHPSRTPRRHQTSIWSGHKVSDDILQTIGYFNYLNGSSISRGIFVDLKYIKVLQIFVKLIILPLHDQLLTRRY